MSHAISAVNNFINDEEGLTTVEYAVAGALITLALVAAFTSLGSAIAATIGQITGVLTAAG